MKQEMPPGAVLEHVRALVRRLILDRVEWLPDIEDGPSGVALVRFLKDQDRAPEVSLALQELDRQLGVAPTPRQVDIDSRFRLVAKRLGLSRIAFELLAVLMAPELDERFLATYRLLWGKPDQRHCDEDFLAAMLRVGSVAGLRHEVPDDHVLCRLGLVWRRTRPGESATFAIDDRLLLELIGQPSLPPELAGHARYRQPHEDPFDELWTNFPLLAETRAALFSSRPVVLLEGHTSDAIPTMIRDAVGRFGHGSLTVDMEALLRPAEAPVLFADGARTLRLILREARLRGAALILDGVGSLEAMTPGLLDLFIEFLRREPGPVYLIARQFPVDLASRLFVGLAPSHIRVPAPSPAERQAMWQHALEVKRLPLSEVELARLAAQPLGPAAIVRSLGVAAATGRDLVLVASELTRSRLSGLASRVNPHIDWKELVFPKTLAEELDDVAVFARHRDLIGEGWGLARTEGNKGIKVLLSGPPGTGKTAVSALLAREAGCELYRVDTGAVVSKWLGETEKHLTELFEVAKEIGAALLFDEADSLFARRVDVQSSNDRYANQSVNHLLQLIEDHPGFVVLTTNNDQLLDSAFARRLSFHIQFPSPSEDDRAKLWQSHLPRNTPRAADVDLRWLATHYELTGGQIRQAVMRAAVHALRAGRRYVAQVDLEAGCRLVYRSLGRLPPASGD